MQTDQTRMPDPKKDAVERRAIVDLASRTQPATRASFALPPLPALRFRSALHAIFADDKKKLVDQRIEALSKALEFVEDTDQRLKLGRTLRGEEGQEERSREPSHRREQSPERDRQSVMSMTTQVGSDFDIQVWD